MAEQAATQRLWQAGAFIVPAVVLGVPYLAADYSNLEGSGVVWGWGLLVIAAVALLARAVGRLSLLLALVLPASALLAVVAVRIVIDTALDPTSHNLWPFEIVIASFLGGIAALVGGLIGSLIGWVAAKA